MNNLVGFPERRMHHRKKKVTRVRRVMWQGSTTMHRGPNPLQTTTMTLKEGPQHTERVRSWIRKRPTMHKDSNFIHNAPNPHHNYNTRYSIPHHNHGTRYSTPIHNHETLKQLRPCRAMETVHCPPIRTHFFCHLQPLKRPTAVCSLFIPYLSKELVLT
jgi:hypothetical protein